MSEATTTPVVAIIAGPNGAGKSTTARMILTEGFNIDEFVNADEIARGLSAFKPESVAFSAGRLMLNRLRELAGRRQSFAFETTLASRTPVRRVVDLRRSGYHVHLLFLCLASPDLAVGRVAARVQQGGHDVPETHIRRRFTRGLSNLFQYYLPAVDSWQLYDNSGSSPRPIAVGHGEDALTVYDDDTWKTLKDRYDAN